MRHLWTLKHVQNASLNMFNRFYWNFIWLQTYFGVLVNLFFKINFSKKLTYWIFLVPSLWFSWWFQCSCFHIKLLIFFLKVHFYAYYAYRTRTFLHNHSTFSHISEYQLCDYYILRLIFLQRRSRKPGKQLTTQKANQCRNSSGTEKRTSSKTCRGENVLHLVTTNYKTKLQINIT